MSDGTTTWTFTYNADGIRTKRTNGSTTYNYVYNGDKLSQMTKGSDTLNFFYDASGTPMSVQYNGTTYYYVTNIQGDVIAILNGSGSAEVEYLYNAWGELVSTTGSMATTLGVHNPLRYRSYVYDQEYGLYYLQSRYYNPTLGRFLNADDYPVTGQGLLGNNMFAYCGNNPVFRTDNSGTFWNIAAGAAIGATISAATQIVTNLVVGNDWHSGVGLAFIAGAVSGGLAASGVPLGGQIIGNALISGISEGANQFIEYKKEPSSFNIKKAAGSVIVATLTGAAAGAIGGKGARTNGSAYKLAIDNYDNVAAKVASKTYSNARTGAKLMARANGLKQAVGKAMTIETSLRFATGAKLTQYAMALYNEIASRR